MPRVGFEPTIPVLKRAKTVHALDREATVNGGIVQLLDTNTGLVPTNAFKIITFCG
jgi:hypothetical protein